MITGARLIRVPVAIDMLCRFFMQEGTEQHFRIKYGVPDGARYVGMTVDEERNRIFAIFEHERFAEVAPGEVIPLRDVLFEKIEPEPERERT